MSRSYEINMTEGPLFGKLIAFSLPLMLSNILQLLFNAADTIVVGRFVGSTALAAVGSTGALINLLINLFVGFSVGANVMVARFYGAGSDKEVEETVHTAILMSLISGVFMLAVGVLFTRQILVWMGSPSDVIDQSGLYLKIYFLGMPFNLLYNFGASILRAVGDTKRPLYYLTLAGVVNVILNLFFVIVVGIGVAGVALATISSQAISSLLVVRCLIRAEGSFKLNLHRLRIVKNKATRIMKVGLPAGIQGIVFSLSNVLIQSSVNSFGSTAMAGNTAAMNIEGFIYTAMNTFHHAAVNFISQNFGANKQDRIRRVALICFFMVTVVGLAAGWGAWLAGRILLGIYSSDPEVISIGLTRMSVLCTTYFLCGIMDMMVGCLRGVGYSFLPMVVSLLGACGLRILWLATIFRMQRTLMSLYISYPVSWIITASVHILCFILVRRRQRKGLI